MDFSSPFQSLLSGQGYSTAATDINGGFNPTPAPASSGVPLPAPTAEPNLNFGGFLSSGFGPQNIITDPNAQGLYTPGPTTYLGGGSLVQTGAGQYPWADDGALSR